MKAYNYECLKCGFDGETKESKEEKKERIGFNASQYKKYDRIVKTSDTVVPCPQCDGMIPDNAGTLIFTPMRIVGGPLGGEDILPALPGQLSKKVPFVTYSSQTLGRNIKNEEEMKKGFIEMWRAKVASADVNNEEQINDNAETSKKRGRPKKLVESASA